nr:class F sortase [Actinomycetales bacterium]
MRSRTALVAVAALLLAGCASPAQPAGARSAPITATIPAYTETAPETDTGSGQAATPGQTDRAEQTPAREFASPTNPLAARGASVEVRSADLPAPTVVEPPVRVVYPAVGADMPVDPVGVAPDGQMEIPEDALVAGWYRFGAAPADEAGSVVVAAHSGSYITPRGPMYDLRDSRTGDRVEVHGSDGNVTEYEVIQVEQLGKVTIDFASYFDRSGERRLVLITCGGRWDAEAQSYDDNIIVTALPVDR